MKYYTELPENNRGEISRLVQEESFKKGWRTVYCNDFSSRKTTTHLGNIVEFGDSNGGTNKHLAIAFPYKKDGVHDESELIPWHDIIEGKLPSPKNEIKAYRITNPDNEDLFKAVQKRFFGGGVKWADVNNGYGNTLFTSNARKFIQLNLDSNTITGVNGFDEHSTVEIPYDQFLKEGIPGVLPTKEEYEAEKERLKWEGIRGKLCWFWDDEGDSEPVGGFLHHNLPNRFFRTSHGDVSGSGWNYCNPMTPEEIDAMTYRGEE